MADLVACIDLWLAYGGTVWSLASHWSIRETKMIVDVESFNASIMDEIRGKLVDDVSEALQSVQTIEQGITDQA